MPELKGTKTEKNLMDAFAGESQARNKYTYFASVAKKEGFVIFVPGAAQGETCKVRITQVKASSAVAEKVENAANPV